MLNSFSTRSSNHRLGISPTNSKFWPLVATVIFALSSTGVFAQSFTETFENPLGTDNNYDTMVAPGDLLNPNFSSPALPSSWGKKSGEIFLGAGGGRGAFWMKHDASATPKWLFFHRFIFYSFGSSDARGNKHLVYQQADGLDGATGGLASILHRGSGRKGEFGLYCWLELADEQSFRSHI
jgi:hypothetical protein